MKKRAKKIKLSIIILNRNTSALLMQCLGSIPKASNYQVIVVDNASTDSSVEMVKQNFPHVELIQSKSNLGYTRGNNLARDTAEGEYVLFLNSDTKLFPETLPEMIKLMDNDGQIGISTCETRLPDGRFYYASHRGFPTPWNSFCYFTGLSKLFPKSHRFAGYTATYLPMDRLHEIDACSGTFLLIRKKILDQIGWFDEDYYSYGDDLEMCFQVKSLGFRVVFNPHVRLIHYWGASSGLIKATASLAQGDEENKKRWSRARYEAMEIFYRKHYQKKYPIVINWVILGGIKLTALLRKYSD